MAHFRMSTPTTTRRSALLAGSAVAVPATAIGAQLASAAQADPVFAAIEAHKAACVATKQACDQLSDLEERLPDDPLGNPQVVIGEERELFSSYTREGEDRVYRSRWAPQRANSTMHPTTSRSKKMRLCTRRRSVPLGLHSARPRWTPQSKSSKLNETNWA